MGKNLIIKGADFSENGLVDIWYSSEGIETQDYNKTIASGTFSTANIVESVQGKDVNIIRVPATAASGSVTLKVVSGQSGSASVLDSVTIELPQVSVETIFALSKTIHINAGQSLFISGSGVINYKDSGGSALWVYAGSSISKSSSNLYKFCIDFGYRP